MSSWNAAPYLSNAANFNAFYGGIAANYAANGLTQSSDAGQINFSTNTLYPTAVSTIIGYQIWTFNDTLSGSYPVYVKLEFGSTSASASTPGIWITVGKGSDGSGNLTGILFARTALTATYSGSLQSCYASSGNNKLLFLLAATISNATLGFCLERTHDASGNDTSDGLILVYINSNASVGSQYLSYSGTSWTLFTKWNVTFPPSGTGASAPNINVYPVRCWSPGETCPFLSVMGYVSGDLATNATFNIIGWDGISRTFVTLNTISPGYGGTGYSLWRCD